MFGQMKTIYQFALWFVTIATYHMYNVVAQCTGSVRHKECIKISGYNDYQWVTCASDSYVRKRTNEYKCLIGPYCDFNCMIEYYGKHSGDVKGICKCGLSRNTTTTKDELECDPYLGAGGRKNCIKEPEYNDYQWVTCASSSYVREKSNGKYRCRRGSYCSFHCMVELYDKQSGDAYDSCRCYPGDPPPRTYAYRPRPSPTASATKAIMNLLACVVPLIASFNLISL